MDPVKIVFFMEHFLLDVPKKRSSLLKEQLKAI